MKAILSTFLIYWVLFVLWRHVQPAGIVFYQGVVLALVLSALQCLAQRFLVGARWGLAVKDSAFSFLLLYSLVFTVPTTVDRAYSVRMILEIEKSPVGLTRAQIEHWFATDFQSQGGVQKRVHEQLVTGSLVQRDERYQLTPLGRGLATSFRWMQAMFATARTTPAPTSTGP